MTSEECKQVFEQLSEYIDGELPPDLCEQLDRHIGDCPPCVQFVQSLRTSTALCKKMKRSTSPDPVSDEDRATLRAIYDRFRASRFPPL